jgi:hypothetical protein
VKFAELVGHLVDEWKFLIDGSLASADAEPFVAITDPEGDQDLPARLRGLPGDYCDRFVSFRGRSGIYWNPRTQSPETITSSCTAENGSADAEGPGFVARL